MVMPWLDKKNLEKWLKTPIKEVVSDNNDVNGYLSKMLKLTVTSQDGRTFPLLVKCRLLDGTVGDIFEETSIFRKEVEFYDNLAHAIQDILKEANPNDQEPIVPECYYACEDFIVFEDLTADGFKMPDRIAGLNLEKCLLVMRTMAKLHAASAVLTARKPDALKQYKHFFHEPQIEEAFGNMTIGFTRTLIKELETWEEEWHKYIPQLNYFASNCKRMMKDVCTRKDSDFNVFIHGDLWISNVMFSDKQGSSIRFVDFQLASDLPAAIDLHYFLYTSPNTEVRANHFPKLIQEYHSVLSSTLKALKHKYIPSLEDIQEELDRKALYALYSITGPYGILQNDIKSGFSTGVVFTTCKTPKHTIMFGEAYRKNIRLQLPSILGKVKLPNSFDA